MTIQCLVHSITKKVISYLLALGENTHSASNITFSLNTNKLLLFPSLNFEFWVLSTPNPTIIFSKLVNLESSLERNFNTIP